MTRKLLLLLLLCLGLLGCGGDSAVAPMASYEVRANVAWPERSREIAAPSSAQSVRFRIVNGLAPGQDFTFGGNRAGDAAHVQQYIGPGARTGTFTFTVEFFSLPDAEGVVVGSVSSLVTIQGDTTLPSVAVDTKVTALSIPPGQSIPLNAVAPIAVEARDGSGNLVPITPGSYSWTIVDGADRIEKVEGGFHAVGLGSVTLRASADGLTTADQTITIFQEVTLRARTSAGTWVGFQNGDGAWAPMDRVDATHFRGRVTAPTGRYAIGIHDAGTVAKTIHLTVPEATDIEPLERSSSASPRNDQRPNAEQAGQLVLRGADKYFLQCRRGGQFQRGLHQRIAPCNLAL